MLRQAAIKGFQALGVLFSLENKEEKTHLEKQDLDSRNVDGGNDRLKVKWFSEIPRCSVRCFFLSVAGQGRHLRKNTDIAI
jgi:hypothetical protein